MSTKPPLNAKTFGQVFTSNQVVDVMLSLRKNTGRVLEPSCGDGAFSDKLQNCVAIEIDAAHAPAGSLIMDFFAYPVSEKFATIIGNPPYVRQQDIFASTRTLLSSNILDARANLYLHFIEKSIHHLIEGGELIFITPRDFLKATSSVKLNEFLYSQGTITHAIDLGDLKVFSNAAPNCLIFRFEKGNFNRSMHYAETLILDHQSFERRFFIERSGLLMCSCENYVLSMKDIVSVKVGAASGADDIFISEDYGNLDFVFSETAQTGKTRRMLFSQQTLPPEALLPFKSHLINRKIKAFNESNWWHWGRGWAESELPRLYVNSRTRNKRPFFIHECKNFDGSVLALFPKNTNANIEDLCEALNDFTWDDAGFVCNGRYLFTQRSLENAPLTEHFNRFI